MNRSVILILLVVSPVFAEKRPEYVGTYLETLERQQTDAKKEVVQISNALEKLGKQAKTERIRRIIGTHTERLLDLAKYRKQAFLSLDLTVGEVGYLPPRSRVIISRVDNPLTMRGIILDHRGNSQAVIIDEYVTNGEKAGTVSRFADRKCYIVSAIDPKKKIATIKPVTIDKWLPSTSVK